MRKTHHERNKKIADAYASGDYLTEHIAKSFGLKRRRVLQIAKEHGVVRGQPRATGRPRR